MSAGQGGIDEERMAASMRAHLRIAPLPSLEPEPAVTSLLDPAERLIAVRPTTDVEVAILPWPLHATAKNGVLAEESPAMGLYLTDRRLLLLGPRPRSIPLADIVEASVAGGRLLLTLHDGSGIALRLDRPSLLRVKLAAARSAQRAALRERAPSAAGGGRRPDSAGSGAL